MTNEHGWTFYRLDTINGMLLRIQETLPYRWQVSLVWPNDCSVQLCSVSTARGVSVCISHNLHGREPWEKFKVVIYDHKSDAQRVYEEFDSPISALSRAALAEERLSK